MKALSSGVPRRRTGRRFSKPQMEKRRRERINHNLETLRLLMLENTEYMNLKNPKVEKAEILESVIHFLKEMKGQECTELQPPNLPSQEAYDEGRRSCLLRISHFISSKSRDPMDAAEDGPPQASPTPPQPQIHSGYIYGAQVHTPVCDSTLSPQHWLQQHAIAHPHLTTTHTQEPLSPLMGIAPPVWRPWPQ